MAFIIILKVIIKTKQFNQKMFKLINKLQKPIINLITLKKNKIISKLSTNIIMKMKRVNTAKKAMKLAKNSYLSIH